MPFVVAFRYPSDFPPRAILSDDLGRGYGTFFTYDASADRTKFFLCHLASPELSRIMVLWRTSFRLHGVLLSRLALNISPLFVTFFFLGSAPYGRTVDFGAVIAVRKCTRRQQLASEIPGALVRNVLVAFRSV